MNPTPSQESELKPCPFCSDLPSCHEQDPGAPVMKWYYWVECISDKCTINPGIETMSKISLEDAIYKARIQWNTRATRPDTDRVIELEKACAWFAQFIISKMDGTKDIDGWIALAKKHGSEYVHKSEIAELEKDNVDLLHNLTNYNFRIAELEKQVAENEKLVDWWLTEQGGATFTGNLIHKTIERLNQLRQLNALQRNCLFKCVEAFALIPWDIRRKATSTGDKDSCDFMDAWEEKRDASMLAAKSILSGSAGEVKNNEWLPDATYYAKELNEIDKLKENAKWSIVGAKLIEEELKLCESKLDVAIKALERLASCEAFGIPRTTNEEDVLRMKFAQQALAQVKGME